MTLLDVAREAIRAEVTGDDKFYRQFLYFFELEAPTLPGGLVTSWLFPLVVNPTAIEFTEPFKVQLTHTLNAGLIIEQNGIIERRLHIRGHHGFAPKANYGLGVSFPHYAANKGALRALPPAWVGDLSGQRHFQYLQDNVFRAFSDFLQDPETARKTRLYYHNTKDDEHWEVVPEQFRNERDSSQRTLYPYDIDLIVVGKGSNSDVSFSEDRSLFDLIKDGIRTVQNGINLITSGVDAVIAFVGELESLLGGVVSTIDSVAGVFTRVRELVETADAFASGVSDFVEAPFDSVIAAANDLDAVLQAIHDRESATGLSAVPDSVVASLREAQDGVLMLGQHPHVFEPPLNRRLAALRAQTTFAAGLTEAELSNAQMSAKNLDDVSKAGTAYMQGSTSKQGADVVGDEPVVWRSVTEHVVEEGDTLQNIAGRLLRTRHDWQAIALLNNLKPPFISAHGIPGTANVGSRILLPSTKRPETYQPAYGIVGAKPEDTLAARMLGVDWEQAQSESGLYDWVLDTDSGGTDTRRVAGVANLVQALHVRMRTTRGSVPLYVNLGVKRLVGLGVSAVDLEMARFRLIEAVTEDPRVQNVRNVDLRLGSTLDVVEATMQVSVRGFDEPVDTKVAL